MSKKYLFVFLFFSQLLLFSCAGDYIFEKKVEIEKGKWQYENTLDYSFEITDTNKVYNLLLEVQHSVDYSFQNCYFKIFTQFPSGEKVEQLLSVDLANKIGQWYGDCGGEFCTILVDLQKKAFFSVIGKHTITLEQYMRKNPLKGIKSLAIKLEDTGLVR